MGGCESSTVEARARNAEINKTIEKDRRLNEATIKLLLLGKAAATFWLFIAIFRRQRVRKVNYSEAVENYTRQRVCWQPSAFVKNRFTPLLSQF